MTVHGCPGHDSPPPPPTPDAGSSLSVGPESSRVSLESLWREGRAQFLDQLGPRQRQREESLHDETTLEATVTSLLEAKAKAEKAYGTRFKGDEAEWRLSRAIHHLGMILRVGDSAMSLAPETASYVWAAFRLLASVISYDFQLCHSVVNAIEQMSFTLFVCQSYAKRQLRRLPDLTGESRLMAQRVLERIPPLLALTMRFAYETRRLVNKGPLRRTLSVFLGGDQELKDIVEEAERKRDELIQASDITYDEAYDQMLHAINQKTEEVGETLGHIQLALNRMDQENGETAGNVRAITLEQLRDRQLRDLNAKLESHLKLLQSEGIADIHEPKKVLRESLERRHPGTCEWIVSDPRFSAWFQPECAGSSNVDSLLWLSGAAGFGKSVLMSYVMDYLERQALSTQSKDKPVVLRFFCKLGNDASQKDAKILANLISQLLFLVVELDDVSDSANAEGCCQTKKRCVDLIDEPKPDGTSLGIGTSVSARAALLCDLARAFNRRVYVLIDALDECEDRGEALLGWLVQVAEADLDVRVLVSSRPESDIQRAFAKHNPPGIEVEKEVTERDVEAYIAGTLRTFSRFDQSKRQKAFARIAERAAGMFRYAHLAIESLRSPAALRRSFKELMDGLPDGLAVLYERELCALEPDKREILMVALRWLVCGEGPISLTLVADELEGTYLHDHPDPEAEDDETEGGNEGIEAGDLSNNHDRPEIQRVGDEERDSIEHLRSAGRNFLKIDDQGIMTLQHTSVRDYVISRSENPTGDQQDALCARCQQRLRPLSTAEAGPKQGHLIMTLRCLEMLNCPAFQKEFLSPCLTGKAKHDISSKSQFNPGSDARDAMPAWEDVFPREWWEGGWDELWSDELFGSSEKRSGEHLWFCRERIAFSRERAVGAIRYEISHWDYHVRAAESLWEEHERGSREWLRLYQLIEEFLNDSNLLQTLKEKIYCRPLFNPANTAIHIASQLGITHYIRHYIRSGGAIDIENTDGETPLHLACIDQRGHVAVRLLVEHGADVNKLCDVDGLGDTPLSHLVRARAPLALIQHLLNHGASVAASISHPGSVLKAAIQGGMFETVKTVLDRGGRELLSPGCADEDALSFALGNPAASEDIIRLLLADVTDVNLRPEAEWWEPPLILAARYRSTAIAKLLLEAGAELEAKSPVTGRTALHEAISGQKTDLVIFLLKHGASVVSKDMHSENAIWHALNQPSDDTTLLRIILRSIEGNQTAKSSLIQRSESGGRTPLHECAECGWVERAELLLDAGGSQFMVSQVDGRGNTPLHAAAANGQFGVVRVLLEHGADMLATNDDGRTAPDLAGLSWLAGEDTTGIYGLTVDVFLRQDMPVPSALRPVLLTLAAEDGSAEVCRRIVQLDRHLAQVPDGHGWTPWMVAAHARQLAVLRILQDLDAMSDDSSDPEPTSDAQHGYPPSAWISIAEAFESRDKLELRKTNPDRQTVGPVFADHPAPFDVSRYYWELDVVEVMEASIALGLSLEHNRYDILSETWHYRNIRGIWLYRSHDGKVTRAGDSPSGRKPPTLTGPKYGQGDKVGCGIDFAKGVIFFTKNGVLLGDVAEIPDRRLFPVVVVSGRTVWLKANFGTDPDKPFKYDPELYGAETEEPTGFRQTT
ncbi:uncharacterized protein THITE_110529 [Thermothielavioides terrestris NRRL 8126]|uniref:B30.2/SPRY domain-containing protein n=1 Tax=Thermothielavioides terrestris (strain ATCC 38088 / NRRL 8126) TaxID=578455 RepID=G2R1N5_THETT|nr:uncharacterized protein THITE_110529 [Thermothielavioides terrestris NRRL 8126]AEO66577.1 hypothetical protein THITE_110529 [Thermothielavioides terrestris NRRL 8126]